MAMLRPFARTLTMSQNDYFGFWFYAGFLLNTGFLSSSSSFFSFYLLRKKKYQMALTGKGSSLSLIC